MLPVKPADRQMLPRPVNPSPGDAIPVVGSRQFCMHRGKITKRILLAALVCSLHAFAQQPSGPRVIGSAEGHLIVTLTVVSSVRLVVGPDGEQRLIVANAADPKDNVSRLQPVVAATLTPDAAKRGPSATRKKKKTVDHR
jgi:hypothetical protein